MFGLHLPSVPGQLRIVISYPTTTGQMSGLGYISYSQVKYWNQEKAERLKPQTARFEHGSVFVPWHCDRSCLSNKKGKQWHSVACNCIQGSTSQKYSGALRYLTSNKTAVALSFAEICRSRLLYLPHTHRHTHSFENRRMSGTDVVLILTYTCLLHRQPCEKTNSVSQFNMLVKAGIHNTTCDHFFVPNCSPLVTESQSQSAYFGQSKLKDFPENRMMHEVQKTHRPAVFFFFCFRLWFHAAGGDQVCLIYFELIFYVIQLPLRHVYVWVCCVRNFLKVC